MKHGVITQLILNFVENKGSATYTEMKNYYRKVTGSNSFSHHLENLQIPYKNRPTRRFLEKTEIGWEVFVADKYDWVESYTDYEYDYKNNPTDTFIVNIDNSNIERTKAIRKELTKIYGPLRLRGRHSNRKKVLGEDWTKRTQNDIPWVQGERVSFYIHDGNKNYCDKTPGMLYKEYYLKQLTKKYEI